MPAFRLLRDVLLQEAAEHAMRHCRTENAHLGGSIVERPISSSIPWVPTFRFGSSARGVRAYEVCRTLQPDALLASLPSIRRERFPVSVGLVVPIGVTHEDGAHTALDILSREGVAVLTFDTSNVIHKRLSFPPLSQHIAFEEWRRVAAPLPPRFRSAFLSAYETYQLSVVQGVQQAGQLVEALVNAGVQKAIATNGLPASTAREALARKIDALWEVYPQHRGFLAAARVFAARYRNPSSHPPSSSAAALRRIMLAKAAMLEAITTSKELLDFLRAIQVNYRSVQLP